MAVSSNNVQVILSVLADRVWSARIGVTFVTRRIQLKITKNTRVSDILKEYGDIAPVMEAFGVRRVGRYSLRRMLTKALTVETAARIHRVSLDEFLETLNKAIGTVESGDELDGPQP
jgi:hypothetical protein